MDKIEGLRDAILRLHGCDARYIESVPVVESFREEVVWQGVVEVFELIGHPRVRRCYAWGHAYGSGDKETRYFAVLEVPPVDSPTAAVRSSIANDYRRTDSSPVQKGI